MTLLRKNDNKCSFNLFSLCICFNQSKSKILSPFPCLYFHLSVFQKLLDVIMYVSKKENVQCEFSLSTSSVLEGLDSACTALKNCMLRNLSQKDDSC